MSIKMVSLSVACQVALHNSLYYVKVIRVMIIKRKFLDFRKIWVNIENFVSELSVTSMVQSFLHLFCYCTYLLLKAKSLYI